MENKIITWKALKNLGYFRLPDTISNYDKAITYDSIKEISNSTDFMKRTDNFKFDINKKDITVYVSNEIGQETSSSSSFSTQGTSSTDVKSFEMYTFKGADGIAYTDVIKYPLYYYFCYLSGYNLGSFEGTLTYRVVIRQGSKTGNIVASNAWTPVTCNQYNHSVITPNYQKIQLYNTFPETFEDISRSSTTTYYVMLECKFVSSTSLVNRYGVTVNFYKTGETSNTASIQIYPSKKCISRAELNNEHPTVAVTCTITEDRPLVATKANTIKFYHCYKTQDGSEYEVEIGKWSAGSKVDEQATGSCNIDLNSIINIPNPTTSDLKVWCGTTGSTQIWECSYVLDGSTKTKRVESKTSASFTIGIQRLSGLKSVKFHVV